MVFIQSPMKKNRDMAIPRCEDDKAFPVSINGKALLFVKCRSKAFLESFLLFYSVSIVFGAKFSNNSACSPHFAFAQSLKFFFKPFPVIGAGIGINGTLCFTT